MRGYVRTLKRRLIRAWPPLIFFSTPGCDEDAGLYPTFTGCLRS
jgi:hypothetical protein